VRIVEYLKVYSDITKPLAVLENAFEAKILNEVNGDYNLTFKMPFNDGKCTNLIERYFVKSDGQFFRIRKTERSENGKTLTVTCYHVWYDSTEKHIPSTDTFSGSLDGDIIDAYAYDVMVEAFTDTDFHVMTDDELEKLGLQWVTREFDFWQMGKTTPCEIAEKIIELTGRGYLYRDNYNVAIVESLGSNKGILRTDKNITNVVRTISADNLVTRLYAYGEDGLPLDGEYIDSSNVSKYGVIDGYVNYNGISTPERLLEWAEWEFDARNAYRIDEPDISYTFDYIDLSKLGGGEPLELGDRVTIYDSEYKSYNEYIVTSVESYPISADCGSVKIGRPSLNLGQLLRENMKTSNIVYKNVDKHGELTSEIINNNTFIDKISDVAKEEVLTAGIIHLSSAFIDDLQVERIETNVKQFICKPNLTVSGDKIEWADEVHTYSTTNKTNIRGYISIEGLVQKYIEAHLVVPTDYSKITTSELQPYTINGRQVYYTSIANDTDAYQYFTFATPQEKYPNMSADNAEMFKIYVRKTEAEYIKMEQNFEWNATDNTYYVKTIYGTGDANGHGRYYFVKDADSGRFVYTSRTDGKEYGVAIKDDAPYLVTSGALTKMYPMAVVSSVDETDDLPIGTIIFVGGV
jgi:hypothetical protein